MKAYSRRFDPSMPDECQKSMRELGCIFTRNSSTETLEKRSIHDKETYMCDNSKCVHASHGPCANWDAHSHDTYQKRLTKRELYTIKRPICVIIQHVCMSQSSRELGCTFTRHLPKETHEKRTIRDTETYMCDNSICVHASHSPRANWDAHSQDTHRKRLTKIELYVIKRPVRMIIRHLFMQT